MFITKYYIIISIILLAAGVASASWLFTPWLIWSGLATGAVAVAYLFDAPAIFRKRQDGHIPLYAKWLFVPFLFGAQLYNSWQRRYDKVPAIQQIDDNLFLGCRLFPDDLEYLEKQGVSAVLDATAEFDGLNITSAIDKLDYLNIPILDHSTPHQKDIQAALYWIHNRINNNQKVVIHCALGRGRSVLILAAYLVASGKADDIDTALNSINQVRATAQLNDFQHKKLHKLASENLLSVHKRGLVIANPAAGGQKWERYKTQIIQLLSTAMVLDIHQTDKDTDVAELVRKKIETANYDAVIACGGDGTVNLTAHALIAEKTPLGIIPLGTTNALAHVLFGTISKISPVKQACQAIIDGHVKHMDVIRCNQHTSLLAIGLGFEHQMIKKADRQRKDELGQLAYISSLSDAIIQNKPVHLSLTVDEKDIEAQDFASIVVANAAPFSSILAQGGGEPNPFDGSLSITVLKSDNSHIGNLLALGARSISGTSQRSNKATDGTGELLYWEAKHIVIRSDKRIDFAVDGEIHQANELDITLHPSALPVFINEGRF